MVTVSNTMPNGFIATHGSEPYVIIDKKLIIVFYLDDAMADKIINEFMSDISVKTIYIYNYDTITTDTTPFCNALAKIFYHIIFYNQDYVGEFKVFCKGEELLNAVRNQMIASRKKITKNDGELWPDVDEDLKVLKAFTGVVSFPTDDLYTKYFADIELSEDDTEERIPIDYVPEGYPSYGSSGNGSHRLYYNQVNVWHHYYYKWPLVENTAYIYDLFITTSEMDYQTITIDASFIKETYYERRN